MNSPPEPGRVEGRNFDEGSNEKSTPDSSDELHQPAQGNARRTRGHKAKEELFTHQPHKGTNIKGRIVTGETPR